jgi:hypothetical protein
MIGNLKFQILRFSPKNVVFSNTSRLALRVGETVSLTDILSQLVVVQLTHVGEPGVLNFTLKDQMSETVVCLISLMELRLNHFKRVCFNIFNFDMEHFTSRPFIFLHRNATSPPQ